MDISTSSEEMHSLVVVLSQWLPRHLALFTSLPHHPQGSLAKVGLADVHSS